MPGSPRHTRESVAAAVAACTGLTPLWQRVGELLGVSAGGARMLAQRYGVEYRLTRRTDAPCACGKPVHAGGRCSTCYQYARRHAMAMALRIRIARKRAEWYAGRKS